MGHPRDSPPWAQSRLVLVVSGFVLGALTASLINQPSFLAPTCARTEPAAAGGASGNSSSGASGGAPNATAAFEAFREAVLDAGDSPLLLTPRGCSEPAWLTAPAPLGRIPFNVTIMHGPVANAGDLKSDTGCEGGCGHRAVGSSIRRGLIKLGVTNYNFQPSHESLVSGAVYIHQDSPSTPAVHQALGWKRSGRVQVVAAGPNIVVSCLDASGYQDPTLDVVITPSRWVASVYQKECPKITEKIRVLTVGVDPEFWKPSKPQDQRKKVLMYLKSGEGEWHQKLRAAVLAAGVPEADLVNVTYGGYPPERMRELLDDAYVMVHVTRTESQGVAAAEAWAMDVPTLTWASFGWEWKPPNPPHRYAWAWSSPSPYLTPSNGLFFGTPEELTWILQLWRTNYRNDMTPRRWLMSRLSDEAAARNMLRMLHCEMEKKGAAGR